MLAASGTSSSGGGNFLVPNGTFVVDVVIFLVVLGVVAKWILPPLQNVSRDRRARIRAAHQAAEEMAIERARLVDERERMLAEARSQARSVVDSANHEAEERVEAARKRGQAEKDRLVAQAVSSLADERLQARDELAGSLEALVVAAAERVLGAAVDPSRYRDLIDAAARAAPGSHPAPGTSAAPGATSADGARVAPPASHPSDGQA